MFGAKQKGTRAEREVVDKLNSANIACERVPLSGSLGGKYSDDVVIGSIDKPEARIEVKNWERHANYLWELLAPVDFLVLRKNRKEPLVVMTIDTFIKFYKREC